MSGSETIYYIYKIVDPETEIPFYVGKTASVQERFSAHCSNKNTPVWEKIKEILDRGLKPLFIIVEQTDYTRVFLREYFWIDKLIKDGHTLYNKHGNTSKDKSKFIVRFEL